LSHVNINDAIQEVLVLLRDELERGGVVRHIDLVPADKPVRSDRVQLQQVLLNLIRNSMDAVAAVTDRPRTLK
jgi:C4-dicarboxylate-specific signal transduction histidine kinase